jgi:hypothetical protein
MPIILSKTKKLSPPPFAFDAVAEKRFFSVKKISVNLVLYGDIPFK